jgi:uroporphyrinogen-III decarboxylase
VENYYGGPSLFGFVRMLLGGERVHYAFYDQPRMVHDMMETATEFALAVLPKALREAPVTVVQFWEDMCYKNGPLLSPAMFREFMLPRYRRITEMIRGAGVDVIFVDSDGDVAELIPLWLEAGINGVFPMEQAAGNDLHAYRRQYGRNLLMTGGIDKRALAQGQAAIDRELETKIPLAMQGGYIPHIDHLIPPDVSYEHFQYYLDRKKQLLNVD